MTAASASAARVSSLWPSRPLISSLTSNTRWKPVERPPDLSRIVVVIAELYLDDEDAKDDDAAEVEDVSRLEQVVGVRVALGGLSLQ